MPKSTSGEVAKRVGRKSSFPNQTCESLTVTIPENMARNVRVAAAEKKEESASTVVMRALELLFARSGIQES